MNLVLLTGFPGFIGGRLIRRLLEEDPERRVVALVEERTLEAARTAAAEIDAQRIELLCGDIGARRLGLGEADYDRLRRELRRVYHLAAIYDLAVPAELAHRVNVEGTGNVLELCLAAEQLERLAYVSTAYVAGERTGAVYEHELSLGQGFKNHYESTKFQAELWVRELMDRMPTTILRPGIVVGDSRTGETAKFDGPYYLLRVISQAQRTHQPLMQFGRSAATFNVVPVDFVVAAIAAAASDPLAAGETLHLVDPDPLPSRELVELLAKEYAGRTPRMRVSPAVASASLRVPAVRRMLGGTPRESLIYLNHPVTFDTRRAVAVLTPHGLAPPRFTDYVGPMVEFFREHERDPAFGPPVRD